MKELIIGLFGLILGSGGLHQYLKFFHNKNKDNQTFDETEAAKYKAAYNELEQEVNKLKLLITPSPAPEWRKDYMRRYVYVSPSYEISVLFPLGKVSHDVLGKSDEEIFGEFPEFVEIIRQIDDEAMRRDDRVAVRRNVTFPTKETKQVIIKEVAHGGSGDFYYLGRCYPDDLFTQSV